MARLSAAIETSLDTDFAMLLVGQRQALGEDLDMIVGGGLLAVSAPGVVSLTCGTRYADVRVRIERWDDRPEAADDSWEDCDELPWQSVPGAGPLVVCGFDPSADVEGLSVEGLEQGRVQVLAKGRHRYAYGDVTDGLAPEEWLLRLWPDAEVPTATAGPPRRIAAALVPGRSPDGWQATMRTWARRGWRHYLLFVTGFDEITGAIGAVGRPFQPDELQRHFGPWGGPRQSHGPYTWDSNVLGALAGHAAEMREDVDKTVRVLQMASGLDSILTFRDAFTCLDRLGLLARLDVPAAGHFVPNPEPRPVWDVLDLAPDALRGTRIQGLATDYVIFEPDLRHVLRWAPGHTLTISPRQLAARLSIGTDDVIGTVRLLHLRGELALGRAPDDLTEDAAVTMTRAGDQ